MYDLLLSRVRLAVIAELVSVEWATFSELQRLVDTTNGNLSAHLAKLIEGGYVTEWKGFVRRRPQTRYRLTATGRDALVRHVEQLQAVIASGPPAEEEDPSQRLDEGGVEHARALIAKAWQARREAVQSPPTDATTPGAAMARVEADLIRACEICEQAGAGQELSVALGKLGHVALDLDHPDKARTLFGKSVAVAREADDPLRLAHAVRHLGQVNHRMGRLESAGRCYEEALALYDRAGTAHPADHANALRPMAALREELGDVEEAGLLWQRAAKLYRSAGIDEGVRECEAHLSGLGAFGGRPVGRPGDRSS